jgi:hypothetical protein
VRDRRALFFLVAAVVCVALLPLAEARYRNLTLGLAGVYVLLAVASYLDFRSRR